MIKTDDSIEGRKIRLTNLREDRHQPRKLMKGLDELAKSMQEVGQTTPILVRPTEDSDTYMVVDGWRRCSAARTLNWEVIDCVVMDLSDQESSEVQFCADFYHLSLNPFEKADELARSKARHGWTDQQVAERLGMSRSEVSSILGLRRLPEDIRATLIPISSEVAVDSLFQVARAADREELERLVHLLVQRCKSADLRSERRATKEKKKALRKKAVATNGTGKRPAATEVKGSKQPDAVSKPMEDEPVRPLGSSGPHAQRIKSAMPASSRAVVREEDIHGDDVGSTRPESASEDRVTIDLPPEHEAVPVELSNATGGEVIVAGESKRTTGPPDMMHRDVLANSDEESFVTSWWEKFTVHALHVTTLCEVGKEVGLSRLDVTALLGRMQGTAILGYTVVVVPVIQGKRVYQLVPLEHRRPDYVGEMLERLRDALKKADTKAA